MKKLKQVLQRHKNQSSWPNPRESIGNPVGTLPDGKCTYWIAKGPARDIWKDLGRNIKNCIENGACEYGSALLTVEMYMFGFTEDTASPQILICSEDKRAREQVLRAIEKSEIMNQHPSIGLGQISKLTKLTPIRLSQDETEFNLISNSSTRNDTIVLTASLDEPFGRRLFIPRQSSSSLRVATAGPILHVNGKVYQLTVGHAFLESSDAAGNKLQGSSSMVETTRQPSLDSGVGLVREDVSAANDHIVVPRKLGALGKLAWISDTNNPNSPDYALVELEEAYCNGSNQVPCEPNGSQRFLHVWQEAKGGPRDVRVITVTASSGFITGELCASASYVRFPNQRTLQELYPVLLEGKLANGDCGSGIIDQATGHLYGHIVMGTAGTGQAYIVSAKDVFQNIEEKMGGNVTLIPPGQILEPPPGNHFKLEHLKDHLRPWRVKAEYSKRGDPSRVVEFASEEYFKKFKQSSQSNKMEDKERSIRTPPKSALSHVSPSSCQVADLSFRRSINHDQPLARKSLHTKNVDISPLTTGTLPQVSIRKSGSTPAKREAKGSSKETGDLSKQKSKNLRFVERFFALPSDLGVHVIAYLCVPDILNLRQVSKDWLEFIMVNETPISREFLENNPVPHFTVNLYPLPAPSELDLRYICGLWRWLSVTSKLSTLMADWITTDIFLRKDETQQLEFLPQHERIRRRLIPIIFTLSHFFETYRHLYLTHVLENDHPLFPKNYVTNPVERHIMSMYNDETLLQAHQAFPILLSYLDRKLRPPSYFGRLERSLHGYVKSPLPKPVYVGILCIGGLRQVTRILKIDSYDSRRVAVDDWYSAVFQQPVEYPTEVYLWRLGIGQKKPKQSISSTATVKYSSINSGSTSNRPLLAECDSRKTSRDAKGKEKETPDTSSFSSAAMKPLSTEHARLLLQDLPALEQVWTRTADALLLARQVVERWQDIKRNGQAMHELILDEFTAADRMFYGCAEQDFSQNKARLGWGGLLDDNHSMRS